MDPCHVHFDSRLPALLSPDVKESEAGGVYVALNLQLDVQNLRYRWPRLRDIDAVDFLHHLTEPGVERRIGCCELSAFTLTAVTLTRAGGRGWVEQKLASSNSGARRQEKDSIKYGNIGRTGRSTLPRSDGDWQSRARAMGTGRNYGPTTDHGGHTERTSTLNHGYQR
jgi:hypothetical protein